jgi:hypothetical protein
LAEFAKYIAEHGPHKTLSTSKRVRVVFNRTIIIDTTKAIYVWEHAAYPQFYVPGKALENCTLKEKQPVEHGGSQVAQVVELSVTADGKEAKTDRVVRFADNSSLGVLAGMVRLEFGSMGRLQAVHLSRRVIGDADANERRSMDGGGCADIRAPQRPL